MLSGRLAAEPAECFPLRPSTFTGTAMQGMLEMPVWGAAGAHDPGPDALASPLQVERGIFADSRPVGCPLICSLEVLPPLLHVESAVFVLTRMAPGLASCLYRKFQQWDWLLNSHLARPATWSYPQFALDDVSFTYLKYPSMG